jgi:anti-sigma B factor antagonist
MDDRKATSGTFSLDEAQPHQWALAGEIDVVVNARFREEWPADRRSTEPVVVDMAGVTFIDSSGLRILYEALKSTPDGERPVLVDVPERAQWIIDVTGLTSRFDFRTSAPADHEG